MYLSDEDGHKEVYCKEIDNRVKISDEEIRAKKLISLEEYNELVEQLFPGDRRSLLIIKNLENFKIYKN